MSREAINELKRIRSILSGVTGLEDDDQEYIEDARKSVDRIIESLAEQPAQQGQVAWTLLLTGENHGLVGKAGEKFVGHPEHYERVDVYTFPQRTWVGLTDEEVGDLSDFAYANDEEFVRNVEAKLKQKNGGVV